MTSRGMHGLGKPVILQQGRLQSAFKVRDKKSWTDGSARFLYILDIPSSSDYDCKCCGTVECRCWGTYIRAISGAILPRSRHHSILSSISVHQFTITDCNFPAQTTECQQIITHKTRAFERQSYTVNSDSSIVSTLCYLPCPHRRSSLTSTGYLTID